MEVILWVMLKIYDEETQMKLFDESMNFINNPNILTRQFGLK